MSEQMCEILFLVNPKMTLEDLMTIIRDLNDYSDVDIDLRQTEIEYDDNGMNPRCYIYGDMPDTIANWQRLDDHVKELDGIEIDYDSMRDWD